MEAFLKDLIEWEDFDDDENPNAAGAPPKAQIGFSMPDQHEE